MILKSASIKDLFKNGPLESLYLRITWKFLSFFIWNTHFWKGIALEVFWKTILTKPFKIALLESSSKSSLSLFGGIGFMVLAKKQAPLNLHTHEKSTRIIATPYVKKNKKIKIRFFFRPMRAPPTQFVPHHSFSKYLLSFDWSYTSLSFLIYLFLSHKQKHTHRWYF